MIGKTETEAQAIKQTRKAFAEVITHLGLMPAFESRSGEEIDRIIEACLDSFKANMSRLLLDDVIPF